MANSKTEIEVKLQIDEMLQEGLKTKLAELGFVMQESQFQRTYRCWRPDRYNSKHGIYPRARMTENLITGEKKSKFTVKWKTKDTTKDFFVREEREVDIENAKTCAEMLSVLGMSDQRILEKKREAWTRGDWDTIITFDILSFGVFMEIEGQKERIETLIEQLGLKKARRWSVAYWDVYKTLCEERGVEEKKNAVLGGGKQ